MLKIHSIQPTWWDVGKVIQSNSVSFVDKWFIYMWYNPLVACKYILYTGIRNLTGGAFRISFLSIPRIVVHGRYYYSQYLFIYLSFLYIYFLFRMTNKIFFISNLIILAFLINFIITSLLFLSSLLLLLLLLLLKLFYDRYVIIITYFGL